MKWKPYESQGIATIDMLLADRLSNYIENKELNLCSTIIDSISFFHDIPPTLTPSDTTKVYLHEAVKEFGNKLERLSKIPKGILTKGEWKAAASNIEDKLLDYIKVLENSTKELFYQLDHTGLEDWDLQLSKSMSGIKELLLVSLNDILPAIKGLEKYLKEFRRLCDKQKPGWNSLNFFSKRILDSTMEARVVQCKKFLISHYQIFMNRYIDYIKLYEKADQSLQKFSNFRAFASLEMGNQELIKKNYRLLKIWELNLKSKVFSVDDISNSLRSVSTPENVSLLFDEYYSLIKKGLFDKSRMIKKRFREVFKDPQARQPLIDNVDTYREELKSLRSICEKYDRYLRGIKTSRSSGQMGSIFGGGKSKQSKQFKNLIDDIEKLDGLCERFKEAMKGELIMERAVTNQIEYDLSKHMQEIFQPLASKEIIREESLKVLTILNELNELSSFDPEVVTYTCKILCLLMRADWKYHVLQEVPLFHKIYDVHYGIAAPIVERRHATRLIKLKSILERLKLWIRDNEIISHSHEVGLDINDIKAYLQDFFASVQGLKSLGAKLDLEGLAKSVDKNYEALLEYRYVFSQFFHDLRTDIPEERLLRKQLLFVDQYFEAIENRLRDNSLS